tara:strand:+ start:5786 stop:5923 length:138 start_codon:yes stop_codon:yes gene_type:complete
LNFTLINPIGFIKYCGYFLNGEEINAIEDKTNLLKTQPKKELYPL